MEVKKIIKNVNKERMDLRWFINNVLARSTYIREGSFIDIEEYKIQNTIML